MHPSVPAPRKSLFPFIGLGVCFAISAAAASVSVAASESLPGLNVLRTGTEETIMSLKLPLQVPVTPARLSFEFGFATDERPELDTFFDSFSLTLRTTDLASTALLLTADLSGITWAPDSPPALTLDPNSIDRRAIPFPSFGAAFEKKFSFSLSLLFPLGFLGRPTALFLDLFDNKNSRGSLGYLDGLNITSGSTSNVPPHLLLQSSASVAGPFADEDEAVSNPNDQTFTVPRLERTRFYRIRADSEIKITQFEIVADQHIYHYEFPSPAAVLQSAAQVEGPYVDEANSQVDLANRAITAPQAGSIRFYRIRSNLHVQIVRQRRAGGNIIFDFEYRPRVLALQSSPIVEGPYADESHLEVNSANQTMTLSHIPPARFYRIRSDVLREITGIRRVGENFVISYGQPEPEVTLQAASAVTGPYQDDSAAQINLANRTISSARTGAARFYRIGSSLPRRITRLQVNGDQVLLNYE